MAADFFRWAIEEYPGERVLAIVSTQGNGPLLQTATEQGRKDGRIALDGTPDGLAGASVLKQVFAGVKRETGRAIDMLVLDGVATQAIELAHELKGLAGLVVGSADAQPPAAGRTIGCSSRSPPIRACRTRRSGLRSRSRPSIRRAVGARLFPR